MRFLTAVFTMFALSAVGGVPAIGGEYTIDLRANGEPMARIQRKVTKDTAIAITDDETEQFDLKEMAWLEETSKQWVSLAQSQAWVEKSKSKTLKSTETAPAPVLAFVAWSLNPTFKVSASPGNLRLTSGHVDYVIEFSDSKKDASQFYRYAIVNAYKKAMTQRKLAPFAELKAVDEMKKAGTIPRKITITMPAIPNSPTMEMEIKEAE